MSLFSRHRWFVAAAGTTLAFAAVCFLSRGPHPWLTAFADLSGGVLMLIALAVCTANALSRPRHERSFWGLMALGFGLWVTNQVAWTIREAVLHRAVPDPFV